MGTSGEGSPRLFRTNQFECRHCLFRRHAEAEGRHAHRQHRGAELCVGQRGFRDIPCGRSDGRWHGGGVDPWMYIPGVEY